MSSTLIHEPLRRIEIEPAPRLGSALRLALYVVLGALALRHFTPLFDIRIAGFPFSITDYIFFGTGLLGFLLVPSSVVRQTLPSWIIIGWCGSLLFASIFAADRHVALKYTILHAMSGVAALGFSRFAIDPAVRKAYAICLVLIGVRWAIYSAGAYQNLPGFETIAHIGFEGRKLVNHNTLATYIAMSVGFGAGYFISQRNRTGYLLAAVVVGFGALVISFSLSRQGVVAVFVGAALAVLRGRKLSRGMLVAILMAVIVAFFVTEALDSGVFGERAGKVEERYDPFNTSAIQNTTGQRWVILGKGVALATRFPGALVGIGAGNFPYVTETGEQRFTRGPTLHNEHFTILIEGGVIALFCWIALLRNTFFVSSREVQLRPIDVGLITAGQTFMVQLLFINAFSMHLWWMIAMVAGAVAGTRLEQERSSSLETNS